ncbi:hypothetical protein PHMEG_00025437 [Phytophthora megakarya]|uniref:Reverse transcriptase Ty1/copia-type domain-containing protein n=1 Tax=Phytophthora megakarya TaxID=4795 RepID=A0A225VD96_9STRA|nr:hypothetical protein PHMEG_00025437 [Phytophthora megakarya]
MYHDPDNEADTTLVVHPAADQDIDMQSIADKQDDHGMENVELQETVVGEIPMTGTHLASQSMLTSPHEINDLVLRTSGRDIVPHGHDETAIVPVRTRHHHHPWVLLGIQLPTPEEFDDDVDQRIVPAPRLKRPRRDGYLLKCALNAQERDDVVIPQQYDEALQSPEANEWKMAIEAGFPAHRTNVTWNITRPPANASIIGSKWVFRLKT